MKRKTTLATLAATGISVVVGAMIWSARSNAADHLDPPARTDPMSAAMGTTADRAADIADIFAYHRGTGATQTLVTALTFSGPNAPMAMQRMSCDRDVLYTIHIDTTGDAMPEHNIRARLAPDDRMNCFVRWEGLPGVPNAVVVPAELTRTIGTVKVFAGFRDDPFFFDLQGFRETLAMAATAPAGMGIRMTNDRDFFAGKNSSAFVVEIPVSALGAITGNRLKVWATTARAR